VWLGKIKCAANFVGLCVGLQLFLFCEGLAFYLSFYFFSVVVLSYSMTGNGSGLCVRAGFGAQNCQPALHLNKSTKLQVCTSPRLTQNPCYQHTLYFGRVNVCHVSITCPRSWAVVSGVYFFKGRRKILKFILSAKVEALLQAWVCVSACVACKCAYTSVLAVNCLCQVSNTFLSVNKVAIAQYYSGQWFLVVRNKVF
jgi:hypothetical protein